MICDKCGKDLPIADFYKKKDRKNGVVPTCKFCCREERKFSYQENREIIVEKHREYRTKNRDSVLEYQRNYYKDHQEDISSRNKKYEKENAIKRRAKLMVGYAIKHGKMEKCCCEVCGSEAEAHHDDYNKPLDVRWLCRTHHKRLHSKISQLIKGNE